MAVNYSNNRGIFTVSDVRLRQGSGKWVIEYTNGPSNYGYFGAGLQPGTPENPSTIERIDFSNDTSLPVAKNSIGPIWSYGLSGNQNYAWFGGGVNPATGGTGGIISSVERLDYSNDTNLLVPYAKMVGGSYIGFFYGAATSNKLFGYYAGGGFPSSTNQNHRIDFSNETSTPVYKGNLSQSRRLMGATGNQNYGYWAGGYVPPSSSRIDRIDYSTDTTSASPRGPLTSIRYGLAGSGNADYAWWGGAAAPSSHYKQVDRTDYSNDTVTASPRGAFVNNKRFTASCSNSSYGWWGGGVSDLNIERVDFSNDTPTASPRGSLTAPRYRHCGISGGQFGLPQSFTPEPYPAPSNFGYSTGGNSQYYPGTGTAVSQVDRINFSNDTVRTTGRAFLQIKKVFSSNSASPSHGYSAGGGNPAVPSISGYASDVQRMSFSDDSAQGLIRGPLNIKRYRTAAAGNSSYMWIAGGDDGTPATVSSVDRIDYSNDTTTASPRGIMNRILFQCGAMGNQNYGWWGGGSPSTLFVSRIDYSNDTATSSPRGNMATGKTGTAGASNANYGYFGAGYNPLGGHSTVVRIDFSNDTGTQPNHTNLSAARYQLGATGNTSYGWWMGGAGGRSIVDRIDYSNDTATASVRGSMLNPVSANSGFSGGNFANPQ